MWLLVQTMSDQLQQHYESFHPIVPRVPGAHPDAISVMAKEAASVDLTIMTALEDTIPDLAQRNRMCVHVYTLAQMSKHHAKQMQHATGAGTLADRVPLYDFTKGLMQISMGKSHPPDLIARVHGSGTAAWRFSLEMILDNGMPVVFTAYQRLEAEWKEKAPKETGARVVEDVEANI
ncbi:hypothetical protein EDD85DRAFT_942473 [Armillaria nabsnona]|nr:hypothetical protein EDD85DRAFT_942473 [Armillaria nabsnona]